MKPAYRKQIEAFSIHALDMELASLLDLQSKIEDKIGIVKKRIFFKAQQSHQRAPSTKP